MPRYIVIESNSGYIWGDSGDLDGPARDESPAAFCQRLDESLGVYGVAYSEVPRHEVERSTRGGYLVYRADIDGSEVVPIVRDGQDEAAIEEVERLCRYECAIEAHAEGDL